MIILYLIEVDNKKKNIYLISLLIHNKTNL